MQAASSSAEPEPEPEPDAGGLAAGVEEQNPLGPLATLTALHRAESGQSIGRSLGIGGETSTAARDRTNRLTSESAVRHRSR